MEQGVVVLGRVLLVVARVLAGVLVVVVIAVVVRIVQSRGGQRARFHGGAKSLGTQFATRRGLCGDKTVLVVAFTNLMVAARLASAQGQAVSGSASCGVGYGQEGKDGAHDDGSSASATSADQRVALVVIGLHGNGRQSQVGAVNANKGCLGKASTRVGVLNRRVDTDD